MCRLGPKVPTDRDPGRAHSVDAPRDTGQVELSKFEWRPADKATGGSKAPADTPHVPWRVEGAPKSDDSAGGRPPTRRNRWIVIIVAAFAFNWILASFVTPSKKIPVLSYTVFVDQVSAGHVKAVNSKGDTIQGTMKATVTIDKAAVTDFTTERPTFADDKLLEQLRAEKVDVRAKPLFTSTPAWLTLLANFGPTLLIIGLVVLGTRAMRKSGGLGAIGGLGRSKAVRGDAAPVRVTFADVAGIDEVEEQLMEIVDMLRNPAKYSAVGAQLPRGVLLSGPPGTGKTLLARAVAGEAGVPFFSASASEFIEMIVGVGASRVRDLFDQAKKVAPSMIFIDELDAIGRARGGGASFGGVDEREQTLNQILTEMDGFTRSDGVVVIAATNRADVLDPALLRPGRFDRRIVVCPPDIVGREAILNVHIRGVPIAPEVSMAQIASISPGMVGADLKNLVNEAALLAAKRGHTQLVIADFTDALEKIVLGAERHIALSLQERTRTAFHEGGHALLGILIPGADPVRKVSIIPRGNALGVTFQAPDVDRYGFDDTYLRGRIVGALGGRAAEEIVFGSVTTGAESDLEQATGLARQMIGRWGMSDAIGPVTVLPATGGENWYPGDPRSPAESTRRLVDEETRRLIDSCYQDSMATLLKHRPQLDRLARALLAAETLDEHAVYETVGLERPKSAPLLPFPGDADLPRGSYVGRRDGNSTKPALDAP